MKITTTAEAFVAALKLSLKPSRKAAIPILQHVLLTGTTITSTDLDLWTIVPFEGKVSKAKKGEESIVLPYFAALDVLDGETGELIIESMDKFFVSLLISGCQYKLMSASPVNFPSTPADLIVPSLTIDAVEFRTMIDRVLFAISREESRYTLNGALLFTKEESATMIGTDGHRLSSVKVFGTKGKIEKSIIHSGALAYLKTRAKGSVAIGVNSVWQVFVSQGFTLISRNLKGKFPDWEAVMPTKNKVHVSLPSAAKLLPVLNRVAKCSDERSGLVKFSFGAELKMAAQSFERGSAEASSPISTTDGGLVIGFNSGYVLDFLRLCGDVPIKVALDDPERPAIFTLGAWDYLLMPMRF